MREVIEVVEKLNNIIFERFGDKDQSFFTYRTNGYWESIEIDGHLIWNSDHDGWDYKDDGITEIPLFNTVSAAYHRWYYNLPLPHMFNEYTTN